jgi:chromosome segregation ATPase
MNKVTNLLKLSNDASEDSIVEAIGSKDAAIEQLKSEIEAKNAEKVELESKLAELQKSINDKETAEKVELIENAVKEGKIDASTKDIYVNSSKTIEELKNVFAALKPAYTPVFNNKTEKTNAPAGRDDPQGLKEMRENDPTSFENLIAKLPSNLSPNYNPATDKRF